MEFYKGDEVSYVGGKSGKTIICIVDGGIQTVQVHWKDSPLTFRMIEAKDLTLIKAAPRPETPVIAKKATGPVFRFVCLECGKKHNARTCPTCGSDERIGNTDADLDPSEALYGSYTGEPYAPSDGK